MDYYNDNATGSWLSALVEAGLIPHGDVDTSDIRDVEASRLAGYAQCHFFAGIGGWPLALQLAGWPEGRPVWTASCPCQPFSQAGQRRGEADERHLWPELRRLIGECRPSILFGEQVASRDGRDWLARVRLDLEDMGYGVGAADLCAAGVGAPHIRQRLYFGAVRLGDPDSNGRASRRSAAEAVGYRGAARADGSIGGLADPDKERRRETRARALAGTRGKRAESHGAYGRGPGDAGGAGLARPAGIARDAIPQLAPAERASPWAGADWLDCRDGKTRRVKPGVPLLADGLPRDVAGALSGFGNAIVPQVAATFIKAFCHARLVLHDRL